MFKGANLNEKANKFEDETLNKIASLKDVYSSVLSVEEKTPFGRNKGK